MEMETPKVQREKPKTSKRFMNAPRGQTSPDGKEVRRTSSSDGRRGTDSSSRRSSQLRRDETVFGVVAEDLFPFGEDNVNEPSQLSHEIGKTSGESDERPETTEAIESWHGRKMNWEEDKKKKRSGSIPTPLVSPFTVNSFAKEQENTVESSNPMSSSKTNTFEPDRRTSSQIKDDPDYEIEGPADEIDSAEPKHWNAKTSDGGGETVSDKGKTPDKTRTPSETPSLHNKEHDGFYSQIQPRDSELTFTDESATHDPIEDPLDHETDEFKGAPAATVSGGAMEQSKSPLKERTRNPEPSNHKKSPYITQNPHTIIHSPQVMKRRSTNSARKSSDSGRTQSPDPLHKSPEIDPNQPLKPENVNAERGPIQDQVAEDLDPVAWFNSDAPLPGNYKAFFRGTRLPRSSNFDHSSKQGSDADSLVMSPTRTDEYVQSEEEDYDGIARANAETLRMFEEYKSNTHLKPTFNKKQKAKDERAARAGEKKNRVARGRKPTATSVSSLSSDGSLLLFGNQDDERSRSDTEPTQSAFEKAKEEEEESQAALHVIRLYRANYELQREMEAKEAKFKRDLLIAWTHSRPPPTTFEEKLDRIALEKIQSKEILNEFGEQQRPIKTDPRLVSRETKINSMITNAKIQYLLEDYRQMYNLANHAVEAASILEFPPLTARCCFYRALAMYFHRDFTSARDDFVKARGCAGLYGIPKDSIERYIHLIDSADDEQTAILEKYPARKTSNFESSPSSEPSPSVESSPSEGSPPSIESSASTAYSPATTSDTATLVAESPRSPQHEASAPPPSSSPNQEERSTMQRREDEDSPTQPLRGPRHAAAPPPDDEPQPAINEIPNYQPQDEAVAEEIRKDIQESKARSLSAVGEAGGPAEADPQGEEKSAIPSSSVASTDWTLLGSTASPGTLRRVPRPRIAPITTSFASPPATPGSEDREERASDEMDPEEIYVAFGGRPRGISLGEDASPESDR